MENISLFETQETISLLDSQESGGKLDVTKLEFIEAETLNWKELFSGFDNIRAITYSSGINFISQLLELFEDAEILFGCEEVMSFQLHEIMSYQCKLVERLKNNKNSTYLISRINDGTLHLYAARTKLSHEKIYLLSAKDGRKRVIMGSANMSSSAFTGFQRENISYMDGEKAYDWYMDCYETLKNECTDQISKEAVSVSDLSDNLDELPVAETINVKKALVIEPVKEIGEDIQFALDVKNLSAVFKPSVPKPDKKGKIVISPEKFKTIRKHIVSDKENEKSLRSEYPQLNVQVEDGIVDLNGSKLNLNPSDEEIQNDVALFLKYMQGYEKFHGDVYGLQRRYFEFANWFFCSPFMAYMRDMAVRYNQNLLPYPVFGLVYGQSKAGKTSFLETLLKMMIGQKTKLSAPDFTRSSIESLKHTVKGAPIIVDDLTNNRFNTHAVETIKNEDFGIAEHLVNYPAVIISANEDVKAVSPEIIRRTVICRVQAGLTNTEVMKSSIVRTVQKEIGTAFYREYLRRMLSTVPDLSEELKNDEAESAPDILAVSSKIIYSIISEFSDIEIPDYIRELTLEDYFSEKVTGSYAIKTIQNAWKINKAAFVVSKRNNELRYNSGATWEADRIMKELPETLEARKSREWIVMNLEEAKEFFAVPFKKTIGFYFRKLN